MSRRAMSLLGAIALAASALVAATQLAHASTAPSFTVYTPPGGLGTDAGEPSVGVDLATGRALVQAGLQTLQVSFARDASGRPTTATWKDAGPLLTSLVTLDPILHTDQRTNRTFVSQLLTACSLMAFSDSDGQNGWTQNPVGCGAGTAVDHQTIGSSVYSAAGQVPHPLYQDAVYYCAQAAAGALCARSDDGGLTFGPGVPMYTIAQCGGLHGHLKSAPDGTVYVPNAACNDVTNVLAGDKQGVAYSTDNGTTWKVSLVPDSSTQYESDPSVAVDRAGTIFFGYDASAGSGANQTSQPTVAVGRKNAAGAITWDKSVVVNPAVKNTQFPAMVAGDDGRAALAYLGTTTAGDDQASTFPGVWHLYVSLTTDGGRTWSTTDVTGSDPVQRGCIWLGGGDNQCRNLLDFIDATVDASGNVVVAYADGCIGTCVSGGKNSYSSLVSLAYQTGGDTLRAPATTTSTTAATTSTTAATTSTTAATTSTTAATTSTTAATTSTTAATTTTAPTRAAAPQLSARSAPGKAKGGIRLAWTAPTSASPITGYEVFRSTTAGGENLGGAPLARVSGSTLSYTDSGAQSGRQYWYVVRAVNAAGPGDPSNEATATAR